MRRERVDVVVIGAGAAGLMCTGIATQRGRSVALLEHTRAVGAKILISGGGRCNFTNLDIRPERFLSDNPHFARSALARYTQHDFIALVRKHGVAFYEKTLGQLFCEGAGAARKIVELLVTEAPGAMIKTGVAIREIESASPGFFVRTDTAVWQCESVVIASGGLSIPKLGASGIAYDIARQFGCPLISPRPALVPLVFSAEDRAWMAPLAGISLEAVVRFGKAAFREGLLFTHRGLSGPSILQISSYWHGPAPISVDLAPDAALNEALYAAKSDHPRQKLRTALRAYLPERLVDALTPGRSAIAVGAPLDAALADIKDAALKQAALRLHAVPLQPVGDEGYAKAEVTAGGVSTAALDQKSMQVKAVPGLFFIGEAVDVTGWLGGYNFQWAWSSAWAAGQAV
jgi:predicted Rossmann fold flavoprotein